MNNYVGNKCLIFDLLVNRFDVLPCLEIKRGYNKFMKNE